MEENIKSIWNDFRAELLYFIKTKVKDEYAAEDILQEVFIKVYKSIEQLEDPTKLKSWLYTTTNNTIIDYYRRKQNIPELDEIEDIPIIEDNAKNMNEEIAECIKSMLHELPDKYKQSLKLYEYNRMKHKDISEKLNLSLSGSKTRVQRARNQLKEMLMECCEFELDAYGNIIDYKRKK
ncbi:RNA polymerase sigma factor SigZ [Clostridium sp. BSD9I1]|uniref:RNA polymerase sigma factor SigZ n=1 Tax=Clostridium sp. BSD9I1 TaxID=2003589 RepID=UPI0016483ED4|nr:RNA polymerase sigma factor SigZ [Clostridium sp. BSD9I1]